MRGVRAKELRRRAAANARTPDGTVTTIVRSSVVGVETREAAEVLARIGGHAIYTAEKAREMGFAVAEKFKYLAAKRGPNIHPDGTGRRQYRALKRAIKRARAYPHVART